MITWASDLIALRAMVVTCSDCSSHSLAESVITTRSAAITMKGEANIDNTMQASTGLSQRASINP